MSTDRTVQLDPADRALKLACAEAVLAAGGQVFVAGEVGKAQSRISDWCSPNTAEFMPVDIARKVEALAGKAPITAALARAQDVPLLAVGRVPFDAADFDLEDWLVRLTRESSDVVQALSSGPDGLRPDMLGATQRKVVSAELGQLVDLLCGLRRAIDGETDTS